MKLADLYDDPRTPEEFAKLLTRKQKSLNESQGYHVKNNPVYGKVLAFNGQTVIADANKASELADKFNGSLVKSMDGRRYIVKLSEAPPTPVN